jgi:hypothetical protein
MAGHSRPKDGVASARLCPAIHVLLCLNDRKDVDALHKAGHDDVEMDARNVSILTVIASHRVARMRAR